MAYTEFDGKLDEVEPSGFVEFTGKLDPVEPVDTKPTPQQIEAVADRQVAERQRLRKINPKASDEQINALSDMEMQKSSKPYTFEDRVSEMVMQGMTLDEARANAKFNESLQSRLNQRFRKAKPDELTGEKIQTAYQPEREDERVTAEMKELARARQSVEDEALYGGIQRNAEANPIESSILASIASGANVANAPQAIINSVIEAGDWLQGMATGTKGDAAKLPKWGFTDNLNRVIDAALPAVARKDLTDAWSDGDFGAVLSAKLAANSVPTALSLAAMFAPPLRAVLLPTMGGMATGSSYAQGDSAVGSVAKGGIEVLTEMLPLGVFDKSFGALMKLSPPAQNQVLAVVGQKLLKGGAAITVNGLTGAIEETLAQIGGNLVDVAIEGKDKKLTEGAADAAILGGITGKVLSTPAAAALMAAPGSKEAQIAAALAGEMDSRDFAPGTSERAADMVFGAMSAEGSGVNREGATRVEAMRSRLKRAAAADQVAAVDSILEQPDVESAIAATAAAINTPTPSEVDAAILPPNPVVLDEDALLTGVDAAVDQAQADQNQPQATAPTEVAPTQQGGTDTRLIPVSQRSTPPLQIVDTGDGAATLTIDRSTQTIGEQRNEQRAVEALNLAIQRTGAQGVRVGRFTSYTLPDAGVEQQGGDFAGLVGSAIEAGQAAFGARVVPVEGLGDFGVAYKGTAFIDIPTLLARSGANPAQAVALATIGHEVTHARLEQSADPADRETYRKLRTVILQYARDGLVAQRQVAEDAASVASGAKPRGLAYAESEVVADVNGAMWVDPKFWKRLYEIDGGSTYRKVLYRFMEAATKLIKVAKGSRLDAEKFVTNVDAVREAAAQAWAEVAGRQAPPKEIAGLPQFSKADYNVNRSDKQDGKDERKAQATRGRGDGGRGPASGRSASGPLAGAEQGADAARLQPLPGAPRVQGFHGPDPRLVQVAEAYARANGFELRRQGEYVKVDPERAARIAAAYEAMPHAPNDPKVRAAYDDLIRQTTAQYRALEQAGYKFWFIDLSNEQNAEYVSTPWNAMRDIRANQTMGVFPTEEGFGSDAGFDAASNPLLQETGIMWPNAGLDGAPKRVLANDLFRAVHDAFGHGLEGAGFRTDGEENAWQAHVRLFTGPAVGAITSETRGQNSWLNYGPHGEKNRTAKVEDTVFADQKTGLMPEWTWTEGRVSDYTDSQQQETVNETAVQAAAGPDDDGPAKPAGRPGDSTRAGEQRGSPAPVAAGMDNRGAGRRAYREVRGAIHYGKQAGLTSLSGSNFGTGIKGAERDRLKDATDQRIKRRVYFYLPVEVGRIPAPEAGLGGHVYSADLSRLYDTADGTIRGFGNAFESAVLDAGYRGFINREQGVAVVLNADVPVQYQGTADRLQKVERRASVAKPMQMTRTEGDELVRRPEAEELREIVRARESIQFAAPSFKLQYGEARVLAAEAPIADQILADANSTFQFGEPQYSKDFDAFNLDREPLDGLEVKEADKEEFNEAALQAELDALLNQPAGRQNINEPTDQELRDAGLHPEAAVPFGEAKIVGGRVEFDSPAFPLSGDNYYKVRVFFDENDKPLAATVETGFSMTSTFTSGGKKFGTVEGATKHAQNQIAGEHLRRRGYDFTSAYRSGTIKKIADGWKSLAQASGAFKYANSDTASTSFSEIADAMGLFKDYSILVEGGEVFFTNKKTGKDFGASIRASDYSMECCTLGLADSDLGVPFYVAAAKMAENRNIKFHADSVLSTINTYRRTEQALSYALKTGKTGVLLPGHQNRVYGYNKDPQTQKDHDDNIARLALANLRNVEDVIPDVRRWTYLPNDTFVNSRGESVEDKVKKALAHPDARALGIGRSTVARAALTSQIIKGEMPEIESFDAPVLYSRVIQEDDPQPLSESWGQLNADGSIEMTPQFKAWFGDSKVVDERGRPLVVYHGTTKNFGRFDIGAERNMTMFRDSQGFYFTKDPRDASAYTEDSKTGDPEDGANVMPVYLRINTPLRVKSGDIDNHPAYISPQRRAQLESQGYDGIDYADGLEFVVFRPEQIKSVFNNGDFDPANPDIRYSRRSGPEQYWIGDEFIVPDVPLYEGVEDGTLAVMPAFRVRGVDVPSLPIKAKVGDHRVADDDKSKSFGAQHLVSNKLTKGRGMVANTGDLAEDAIREIAATALTATRVYHEQGNRFNFFSPETKRLLVAEWRRPERYLSVVTSIPSDGRERRYGDPSPLRANPDRANVKKASNLSGSGTARQPENRIAPMQDGLGRLPPETPTTQLGGPTTSQVALNLLRLPLAPSRGRTAYIINENGFIARAKDDEPAPDAPAGNPNWPDKKVFPGLKAGTHEGGGVYRLKDGTLRYLDEDGKPVDAPQMSRSDIGFYSALARGIEGLTANSAPAAGWKDAIKGLVNKGIAKADEVEWSGVNDWLDMQRGRVTKDQVLEYLNANGVRVDEVVLGDEDMEAAAQRWMDERARLEFAMPFESLDQRDQDYIRGKADDANVTPERESKYSQYTLPGGENYREVLLTLPEKGRIDKEKLHDEVDREYRRNGNSERHSELLKQLDAAKRGLKANTYRSRHWDQPNVIAHIRVNDRTDADGKRVLFVEEVQSDWGQQGKKEGFDLPIKVDGWTAKRSEGDPASGPIWEVRNDRGRWVLGVPIEKAQTAEQAIAYAARQGEQSRGGGQGGIPVAPFVTKTEGWLNLALKRVITMAVEGGYDKVAFINGEQSADRYDLSKQVDAISWERESDSRITFTAEKDGGNLADPQTVAADKLDDYLGKEIASKIVSSNEDRGYLEGVDLKVGGEGMKAFYDKIVPAAVKKLLPKVGGGQVEVVNIESVTDAFRREINRAYTSGSREEIERAKIARSLIDQPGFTITDAMRDEVDDGLPMFSRYRATTGANFNLPGETRFSKFRRLAQDYFLPVLEVQRAIMEQGGSITEQSNVYRAEERMYGRVEETLRDFRQKWFDPMIQKAQANDITMDELSLYAYAKHAKERNAHIQNLRKDMPDSGSGMTNDEADDILTMFSVNGKTQIMEDLHQDLMAITAATRREMLDTGLITQDEYDGMENQFDNYVPLRGFENVDINGEKVPFRSGGRGFNIRGKETVRALGRRTRAGNILENIVLDYERAVFRGERNFVGKVFLKMVQDNPDPKLWEIDAARTKAAFDRATGKVVKRKDTDSGPDTISVKIRGREVYIKIHDERLLRAMRKASKDETGALERFVSDTAGQFTGVLRASLTQYNPIFGFINALRDVQSGGVAVLDELGAEGVARYVKHYRAAIAAAGRHQLGSLGSSGLFFGDQQMDRYFEEYRAAGGTTGGYYGKSAEDVQQEIRNVLLAAGAAPQTTWERMKTLGGSKTGRKAMRFVQGTGKVLEFLGATSENAARVAAFRAAREMGKSPAEAASIAKNLTTNFNRKGEWGQVLNGLYLFYNAAIQGSHRTLKALKRGRVQGLMAGLTAMGAAAAYMAVAVGGDDEDDGQAYWDKIPTHEKERNFIIMLPPGSEVAGAEKVGSAGRYIKIPMPYGFNVFPMLGTQIVDVIRNQMDETRGVSVGRGAVNMVNAVMGSFNPFGGAIDPSSGTSLGMAVAPTVADIGIQMAAGVDGFNRPTAPYKSDFDLDPDSENVNARQAGSIWHEIARGLNKATGGDEAESGFIDVAPGTIENLWRNVTGGTGTFLADVFVNIPTKLLSPEAEITPRDIPLLRNFYGMVDGVNDSSLMYERRRDILRARTIEKNREDLGVEPSDDPEVNALASMSQMANQYTKAMSDLRKEEIALAEAVDMTTAEKNIRRRELRLERDELARQFNAEFMEVMRSKRDGDFDAE